NIGDIDHTRGLLVLGDEIRTGYAGTVEIRIEARRIVMHDLGERRVSWMVLPDFRDAIGVARIFAQRDLPVPADGAHVAHQLAFGSVQQHRGGAAERRVLSVGEIELPQLTVTGDARGRDEIELVVIDRVPRAVFRPLEAGPSHSGSCLVMANVLD